MKEATNTFNWRQNSSYFLIGRSVIILIFFLNFLEMIFLLSTSFRYRSTGCSPKGMDNLFPSNQALHDVTNSACPSGFLPPSLSSQVDDCEGFHSFIQVWKITRHVQLTELHLLYVMTQWSLSVNSRLQTEGKRWCHCPRVLAFTS